jgi:hypothetical protein
VKEAWARATHEAMGHLIAHRRWVHLYVDGLYWGIYELGERINEDFMRDHTQAGAQFDVLKQATAEGGIAAENGNRLAWDEMIARATAAAAAPADGAKWTALTDLIDLDNYIDYLLVNMFARNTDWPENNWRAARRKDLDDPAGPVPYPTGEGAQRFRFFIWDAEISLRGGQHTSDPTNLSNGVEDVSDVHQILMGAGGGIHPSYQAAWKARVTFHFDQAGGVFYREDVGGTFIHEASVRFDAEAALFEQVLHSELARWGDAKPTLPRSHAEWLTSKEARSAWLRSRRAHMKTHLINRGLAD